MKKLRRVIGSVANLSSGRNDEQHATSAPRPGPLSPTRRSASGPLHDTSPQRGSYYSYETQSLDSFNSGLSSGISQVDPYSKVDKSFTKLHKWAYLGDIDKLKKFIKKVPVDAQDSEGKTALHHAAAQGHGDALLFLLGSKSNVEMKDNAGMTAFLRAVERSQLHIVQMLLQRRVDMRVTDYQGNSCIHLAARTGATDLLLVLLDCGGDCDAPNNLGRTPIHVACAENQEEAVEAFLRHGASVNVADKEGVTPLMVAAKVGSVPLVETLVDNGASISPVDASKWTAADYARFTNHNQLHHRLKTLLDKEGGVSLIPQGLLSVSDEGSDQTEGAAGGLVRKVSDEEEEEEGAENSWSDTSDVNSVKEKPKLNLAKFLPSSDEDVDDVGAVVPDPISSTLGPPKPPRLYTSSSSLASDKATAERSDAIEKGSSLKDENDSWKSSSEEEESKIKSLGLFMKNCGSSNESDKDSNNENVIKIRRGKEDLVLDDTKYDISGEDVSFEEEEKPDLPLEGTPTKVIISPRNAKLPDHIQNLHVESLHLSHQTTSSPYKNSETVKEIKSDIKSVSSPESGSKNHPPVESPFRLPTKRSPRKIKSHQMKPSQLESDSDEVECSSLPRPPRRKGGTPKKQQQQQQQLTELFACDEGSWGKDDCSSKSKSLHSKTSEKSSKGNSSQDSVPESQPRSKVIPNSGKEENVHVRSPKVKGDTDPIGDVNLLAISGEVGSCTNTLSTVVGTLGREGTMQEIEEVWEANASRRKAKSSSSNSSTKNSEESSRSVDQKSNGKSRKEDTETVKNMNKKHFISIGTEKGTHTQLEGITEKGCEKQKDDVIDGVETGVESEDTAQDVSDDDFGSSGVEDLLASKVKVTSPATYPFHQARTSTPTKHSAGEAQISSLERKQQFISCSKPLATRQHRSPSALPRELEKEQSTAIILGIKGNLSTAVCEENSIDNEKKESASAIFPSHLDITNTPAPRNKGGLRCALGGVVLSDEESNAQDHFPVSPQSLEGSDDRVSVTSTETEESTHINAGLKNSLLAPLSSLPDASSVDHLQDLVRELRLKLEKELGHRVDLEARVTRLKQQEKQTRLLCAQQEQNAQQRHQEVSNLMARIRQLEYQGQSAQDSSCLKDHTLQDAQQRCSQLEEQCGALQLHAQQQDQLVNSLMVQLRTKDKINITLQEKLEEFSSQTKFVSMKSCQTEDFLMAAYLSESVQAQSNQMCQAGGEDGRTPPTVSNAAIQTEASDLSMNSIHSVSHFMVDDNVETKAAFTQTEPKNVNEAKYSESSTKEMGVQIERKNVSHVSTQSTPQRAIKSSQTLLSLKSSYVQTEMTGPDCLDVHKKITRNSSCQTLLSNRQTGVQTDPVSLESDTDFMKVKADPSSQIHVLTSALESVLQDFSEDIKSYILKSSENCDTSAIENMKRSLSSQIESLANTFTSTFQQVPETVSQERLDEVQEGIYELKDTLETQLEVVQQLSDEASQVKLQTICDTVEEVNLGLKSSIDHLGNRLIEALQSQESDHHEHINSMLTSLKDFKWDNGKLLNNISNQLEKRKEHDIEKFIDLKEYMTTQLTEVKKAIESSSQSEDSGVPSSLTRGVVEKLDSIERSLSLSGGRSCVPGELSEVQLGVQQLSDDLHEKISSLEEIMQTISSDSKLDQAALMEQTKAIHENNSELTALVNLRLSEANTDLSEAIEENFRIVQDHLHHLQQTVLQRVNEISEHMTITEDKKASNLSRQMIEVASQVSGVYNGLLHLQSSLDLSHNTPPAGGAVSEALVSSLKSSNEQVTESIRFQNESIIQQLEALQKEIHKSVTQGQVVKGQIEVQTLKETLKEKEIHKSVTQGQVVKGQIEVQTLKETLKEKEAELASVEAARERMQDRLNQQKISLESMQSREEEQRSKVEALQDRVHDLTMSLREKEQRLQQEAVKSTAQSEDVTKLRQENFRLSSEHNKLSALLQAEQHQRQWCEGELQGLREAKDITEKRIQEIMSYVQQSPLQRTPPTGRDNNDDDDIANEKLEIEKLSLEKKKMEETCTEQKNLVCQLELQLREAEVSLGLEKNSNTDLEKQLKKAKESVTRLQQDLREIRTQQEAVQDVKDQVKELEVEIKSREAAMDILRKKLENINKEKLDLKNTVMQLKEEKLSFELIKQEKEFTEQMQRKTEEQLHELQRRIPQEYVSKTSLQVLQKELESKYQLELSSKLAELNQIIQEKNKQQESLSKDKDSREQELKNELSRKSEEVIRLNAKLSVLDERGDTWRVRHDRLLALYQQQADLSHTLAATKKHSEDPLSISLQEIDKHLKTPLASSSFLEQLTPPVSLQLPPPPTNIDSYHYTHAEALDRTLRSYLNTTTHSRYTTADDKPQAKISPLPPSPQRHSSRVPDLDQCRDDYVDLLKMKYGI